MKVWKRTHAKIKILAAYDGQSMQDTLEAIVQAAFERKEKERIRRGQQAQENEEKMMDNKPTLLEQTRDIRERYHRGDITPAEAKILIKPYYDEYIRIAKEKAKAAGMRMPQMSLEKFLARRSDLRYAAQQSATEQRERQ